MKLMHWLGHEVEVAQSAGGVFAFVDPWDGVVHGGVTPWPPPELTQKLYQSRQARAYRGPDGEAVTRVLGHYSDLQSVHSEDAVTWSLFGPLAHALPEVRRQFAEQLLQLLGLEESVSAATVWLWRRLPHPDNLVPGGPEIDVGIQTDTTLVLVEAKWRSAVGAGQGVARDKDQIQIRAEFCGKYGSQIYPGVTRFVVLAVGQSLGTLNPAQLGHADGSVSIREMTWGTLGGLGANPTAGEFRDQLRWREEHSQLVGKRGVPRNRL